MSDKIREALQEIAEYPSLDAEELQRIARAALDQQHAKVVPVAAQERGLTIKLPSTRSMGCSDDYRRGVVEYRDMLEDIMRKSGWEVRIDGMCIYTAAEQPDTVAVPRELLDAAADTISEAFVDTAIERELRTLLAGGEK